MRTDEGWPISEGVLWYLQSRLTTVASIYFHMHSVPAAIRALLLTPRQEASKLGSPRYRLQISQYPLTYIGQPSDFIGAIEVSGLGVGGSAHQQAPSKHRRLRYRLSDIYITKRVLRCVRKDICVICGSSSDKGVAAYTSAGSIEAW